MSENAWSREKRQQERTTYSFEELRDDLKLPESTLIHLDCGGPTCCWRRDGPSWIHVRHHIPDSSPAWLLRFKGLCRRPDGERV
jgi:hypothetical protein